jgi:hypothetical protein
MDKIDRLIQTVRTLKEEGGMVVGTGGFTSSANPAGPVAGYDKVMEIKPPKPQTIIGKGNYPGARKRWKDGLNRLG